MHNGFLQVESEKMSKSLGNFVTIRELLETGSFGDSTWPGDALRLAMLRTHYRQPIDWTVKELKRAYQDLTEWYGLINFETISDGTVEPGVVESLFDDLNTHGALMRMHELAKTGDFAGLRASLRFLGFSCDSKKLRRNFFVSLTETAWAGDAAVTTVVGGTGRISSVGKASSTSSVRGAGAWFESNGDGTYSADAATEKRIKDLIQSRKLARKARNFAEADRVREELGSMGVTIKDNKDGTTTWEPRQ
jgi:cysteinyl-tRNA synthetase